MGFVRKPSGCKLKYEEVRATSSHQRGRFIPGKNYEQFLFNEDLSSRGEPALIEILNKSLANLESAIEENQIDITTEEGFNRVRQIIEEKNTK